jgi:hypothetical protein
MKKPMLFAALLPALFSISAVTSAAILEPTVVDFGYKPNKTTPGTILSAGAYYGKGNLTPLADGTCPDSQCIHQNGMVVSTVDDPNGNGEHLHATGALNDHAIGYHNDASGVYVRTLDSSSFGLISLAVDARLSADTNPYNDPAYDYWEILGFSDALNPDLSSGDGTNYSNRVAYQTVENGFVGTVLLNDDFKNVGAVWFHFANSPNVQSANFQFFYVQLDDLVIHPAVTAPVPLPGAAWIFGSGLMGLMSLGRKRAVLASAA